MEITYLGHASFKIRGKGASIVTDPFDSEMVGLKFPRHLTCDIVTVSHDHHDHNAVDWLDGEPFIITGPGEYEIKGVQIVGKTSFHDGEQGAVRGKNTLYRISLDDLNIVHLGDLGHLPNPALIEELDGVDILLVPVGGIVTLGLAQAKNLIAELSPSIAIPMHYGRPELNPKFFADLHSLAIFLKEMGQENISPQAKLTISRDKLPEEMQIVVLQ